jgi:hypothetical protein
VSADIQSDDQAGDEVRPWEQPGAVRRDCSPHRAGLLRALGTAARVCGLLSLCLAGSVLLCGLFVLADRGPRPGGRRAVWACCVVELCQAVPALVALPLGLAVRAAARRDLARMGAGLLDPAGRQGTQEAGDRATLGAALAGPPLALALLAALLALAVL